MIQVNESMKKHLIEALNQGVRQDNRKIEEYRDVEVEYGISSTAEGSARVRFGETEVIAGVKLSVGTPYPDSPEDGVLMVGTELIPLASPKFESGPPSINSIELSRVIDRGIREAKTIDTKKLCIEKGEKVWIISVDLVPINAAGNLFDVCGMAALAALQDARFPTYKDGELNYKKRTDKKLPLEKLPLPVTVYKVGGHLIIDPISDEEEVSEARLTVTMMNDKEICALQKGGDAQLTLDEINGMVSLAVKKSKELRGKL